MLKGGGNRPFPGVSRWRSARYLSGSPFQYTFQRCRHSPGRRSFGRQRQSGHHWREGRLRTPKRGGRRFVPEGIVTSTAMWMPGGIGGFPHSFTTKPVAVKACVSGRRFHGLRYVVRRSLHRRWPWNFVFGSGVCFMSRRKSGRIVLAITNDDLSPCSVRTARSKSGCPLFPFSRPRSALLTGIPPRTGLSRGSSGEGRIPPLETMSTHRFRIHQDRLDARPIGPIFSSFFITSFLISNRSGKFVSGRC